MNFGWCTIDLIGQYEISNFSTLGFRSRHNGNYWAGVDYLGLGPSAHSYDRVSRQWNVSNNIKYCAAIEQGLPYFEGESLTAEMIYNETVMTHLRTMQGISLKNLKAEFRDHFVSKAKDLLSREDIKLEHGHYKPVSYTHLDVYKRQASAPEN